MEGKRIFIAGFGGQGVLLIGQMIAYGAMHQGKEVTWMPSYGPEMRGGTANCTVCIDDKKIASPLASSVDILVVMNGPSLEKFEDMLVPGGLLFINSSIVKGDTKRRDVIINKVDCMGLAEKMGNVKAGNMVMLGAILKKLEIIERETMIQVFKKVFTGRKAKFIDSNTEALDAWKG